MTDYRHLQQTYELDVYSKKDIVLVRGRNARVYDDRGREYIDCTSGHGVASVGHANERVAAAVAEQAQRLITCGGAFYNDRRAVLMEKLMSVTPPGLQRVFFCNSGAESVEAAIKFARFATGKTDFICAMRGFHGRTMGALSATFQPHYRTGFEPLVPGFFFVPFNKAGKLKDAVTEKTAGVILEIVQGEGGVNIGSEEYFHEVAAFCREQGILLIIDEVQTGFCRTGRMFACEHYGISPDIMCVGKAIAGGLPMGAVLCSEGVALPVGKHGSTFGGNPLACAAAIAAIDFMTGEKLDEEAAKKGEYLARILSDAGFPVVREIRHIGLMFGIELKERVQRHIVNLMESGVLALPAGPTVLRLLPPLTIGYDELDEAAEKIIATLHSEN